MPSLVNQTEYTNTISAGDECGGETAGPSGFLWLAENLSGCSSHSIGSPLESILTQELLQSSVLENDNRKWLDTSKTCALPHCETDAEVENDVSSRSVSRTYDEEDFVLPSQRMAQIEMTLQDTSNSNLLLSTSSYIKKINETSRRSNSFVEGTKDGSNFDSIGRNRRYGVKQDRKMGPNEQLYMQQYHTYVSNEINKFRESYPEQLPVYSSMTYEEKLIEQQFVMDLLERLNISNCNKENAKHLIDDENDFKRLEQCSKFMLQNKSVCDEIVAFASPGAANRFGIDTSVELLTPAHPQLDKEASRGHQINFSPISPAMDVSTSIALLSPPPCEPNNNDDSSTHSIEMVRAASQFDSPHTTRYEKKRFASTSGKRGADMVRVRLDDTDDRKLSQIDVPSPSKFLINSIDRLSLVDNASVFSSSQSPIAHTSPYSPMHQNISSIESVGPDISFGDDNDDHAKNIRPIFDNDSLVETAMLPDKRVHWDFDGKLTKEAPTAVRLLDGETMRWAKLPTERKQGTAPPTQTFPDPLSLYPDSSRRRLKKLYSWILRRDQAASNVGSGRCAAVLSVTDQNVTDLILKLLLEHPLSEHYTDSSMQNPLLGSTLVVTRSKEELEIWKRSFREGSTLSVLNHATMPMTQRKSQSCADKSIHFDIVLTTYDSLKSPDVALKLDSSGFAITARTKAHDGWYTSSSSSQHVEQTEQTCKQLSALHRVKWRRLILVDILGRKSYLSKLDTARVKAVRALNADTRFAFFVSSDDCNVSGIEALVKSDKTALTSLSSALRVENDGADLGELFHDVVIDFQSKSKSLATSGNPEMALKSYR
jgi:hypothetical protein